MPSHDRSELAQEVRDLGGRLTAAVGNLHGLIINDTLGTETVILDGAGLAARDWSVPYGSLAVHNGGAAVLTITSNAPQGFAPTCGPGVAVLPAGAAAVVALAGRSLTLYGTPGARVTLSVFSKPQPPAWAQLAALA